MSNWFIAGIVAGLLVGSLAHAATYPEYSLVGRTSGGVLVPVAVNSSGYLILN